MFDIGNNCISLLKSIYKNLKATILQNAACQTHNQSDTYCKTVKIYHIVFHIGRDHYHQIRPSCFMITRTKKFQSYPLLHFNVFLLRPDVILIFFFTP